MFLLIRVLNTFSSEKIILQIRSQDIIIGLTIYLKTSVDFAIFIGNLMNSNPGWKKRIAIETGTALGNALGTFLILIIWSFFKEVDILLAAMIIIASLVLFRLAQDGLDHAKSSQVHLPETFNSLVDQSDVVLTKFNNIFGPILNKLIPHRLSQVKNFNFWALISVSFSIPFILGLDDFAGYVPLFDIINVFGFAIGVFAGHAILNAFLFISPSRTITLVKNPYISFAGSIAFVLIAIWGIFEASKILFGIH